MDLIDAYVKMLSRLDGALECVQDTAIQVESLAHTLFAADTYSGFPDSYDLYEMAHDVRSCALRAAVELANMSSAMETIQMYMDERRALLEARKL